MKKKRVLLVCYYFPPLGGAGVGRPLSLFKYLPQHGCECDVLTVKPVAYRVFEPELLEHLDLSRIHRAGSLDPQRLMYLSGLRKVKDTPIRRGRPISRLFFPDPQIGWVRPAVRLGRTLVGENGYDAVISSSPPISCHLVARKISAACGIPWIADFRDPWVSYEIEQWFQDQTRIKKAWALLRDIRKRASRITVVNSAIAEYLGAGEVILNSYDDQLAELWRPPQKNKMEFIIGLLGTFDELVPVEPLLKVIAALRDKAPDLFRFVKLVQVGRVNPGWFMEQLRRYGLAEKCERRFFQGRRDTVEILSATSLAYLGLSRQVKTRITTGRIFDLLASGRPILAAVPDESEVGRLIADGGNGHCFDEDTAASVNSAAEYLRRRIELWQTGKEKITPLPAYARGFSADKMAGYFAGIIQRL